MNNHYVPGLDQGAQPFDCSRQWRVQLFLAAPTAEIGQYSIEVNTHCLLHMPIEAYLLRNQQCKIIVCPKCHGLFEPFMRGQVQRRKKKWFLWGEWDYCALICSSCKEIVGYETPWQ